jgi:hypothetical protein
VKLLSLPDSLLSKVPKDEYLRLKTMIDQIFVVDEIDEYSGVWVEKQFPGEEAGQHGSHSVSLDAHEMEPTENTL